MCHRASHLAVSQPGRIGNLVLSVNKRNESLIREPEMVYAFGRVLDGDGRRDGIEVPTVGLYRFTPRQGRKTIRARHDLVLFDGGERDVLVEFKKGQPGGKASPAIGKDFQKLLREEVKSGKAMFHICHAAKQKTVPALIGKYNRALAAARAAVAGHDLTHNERNWFALYILVLIDRRQKRVILLSRRAGSLPELLEKDPVFQYEDFNPEYVPRT